MRNRVPPIGPDYQVGEKIPLAIRRFHAHPDHAIAQHGEESVAAEPADRDIRRDQFAQLYLKAGEKAEAERLRAEKEAVKTA